MGIIKVIQNGYEKQNCPITIKKMNFICLNTHSCQENNKNKQLKMYAKSGGLAQSEEHSVRNVEAPGSKPGFSK